MPDAVINAALAQSYLSLIVVNSYVDFEDYSSPVKRYLDDKYSWKGNPSTTKKIRMFAKENSIELRDNRIGIAGSEYKDFISLEDSTFDIVDFSSLEYFDITINLSTEKSNYQRSVFTLFDLSGLIGGLFEVLTMIFGIFVAFISKHSFYHSIFKRLYQVDTDSDKNRQQPLFPFNNRRRVGTEKIEESKYDNTNNDELSVVEINKREVR
jgi:hypothetical protein